jgi:DNA-binding transcriptional ArsR family regulator
MAHPVRRLIQRELSAGGAPLSPAQLAKRLDLPPAVVTYHATVLQKCGAVEVVTAEDG